MPRAVAFAIRVCMALTVLCFVGGLAFVAAAFFVSAESALAARPFVLKWFGFLLFAVLAGYVLIYHASTQDITPRQANALAFAHCPTEVKRASYVPVYYTHLRAHETPEHLVCRLLLE